MRAITSSLLVFVLASVAGHAGEAGPAARLQSWLNGLTTLQASFTQTVLNADLEPVKESRGDFYLQRPGRFRWNTTAPFEQTVVADGRNLWTWDPELEQATVKPLKETLAASPASLLTGKVPLTEEFSVEELGKAGELDWVKLTPKTQDSDFQSLRVGMNDGHLDTMELVDNLGQTTRIRFENVKRNVALDADLFRFDPPEGADLIGKPEPVTGSGK